MTNLLKIILSLSLSGTLLILIFFLFSPLWKDKFSKRWQYYIWLIVIIRLLVPFSLETNLIGLFFQQIEENVLKTEPIKPELLQSLESSKILEALNPSTSSDDISDLLKPSDSSKLPDSSDDLMKLEDPILKESELDVTLKESSDTTTLQPVKNTVSLSIYIFILWFAVALILLIRKITIYQDFVHYIKVGWKVVDDIEILNCFGSLLSEKKIKRKIELTTNNLIASPLFMGILHPYVVLPNTALSDSDFRYIICHELTHYKRCDILYKWLVQLTICIHWFNPCVYFMGKKISQLCELSCDEAVLRNLNREEKAAYGDTLLNAMETEGSYKDSVVSITLHESKKMLKERLDSIVKYRKKSKLCIITSIILTMTFCFGAAITGVYGMNSVPDNSSSKLDNSNSKKLQTAQYSNKEIKVDIDMARFKQSEQAVYGPYFLKEGITWGVNLEWIGNGMISVSCKKNTESPNERSGEQLIQQVNSPINHTFKIIEDGEYIFTISNQFAVSEKYQLESYVTNLKGTIYTEKQSEEPLKQTETDSHFPYVQFSSIENKAEIKAEPYMLLENKPYTITVNWNESGSIPMTLTRKDNGNLVTVDEYIIKSGVPFNFTVPETDRYSCVFINTIGKKMTNFSCSISKASSNTSIGSKIEEAVYEIQQSNVFVINETTNGTFSNCKFIIPSGTTCTANLDWKGDGNLYLSHEQMDLDYEIKKEDSSFKMKEGIYQFVRQDDSGKGDIPKDIVGTLTFTVPNRTDDISEASKEIIQIPISIKELKDNEVCVAEIPDLKNAVNYYCDIKAEDGTGALYTNSRKVNQSTPWYNYLMKSEPKHLVIDSTKDEIGTDKNYSGNYAVYIGGQKGSASKISGIITIEYNTNINQSKSSKTSKKKYKTIIYDEKTNITTTYYN